VWRWSRNLETNFCPDRDMSSWQSSTL